MSAVAAGTIPFIYPFSFWTVRGMEVGLLGVVFLAMVLAAPMSGGGSSDNAEGTRVILVAALAMVGIFTRLDFAALTVGILLWMVWWAPSRESKLRTTLLLGGAIGISIAAVVTFQKLYFGAWLPNTYRLKMEGFPPQVRLLRGAVTGGKVLPLIAMVLISLGFLVGFAGTRNRRLGVVLGTGVLSATAYSLWVGGRVGQELAHQPICECGPTGRCGGRIPGY